MGLLRSDGFPYDYSNGMPQRWSTLYGGSSMVNVDNATPRFSGGRYMWLRGGPNGNGFARLVLGTNYATLAVQFGYRNSTQYAGEAHRVFRFMDGTTTQIKIRDVDGLLHVYRNATWIATASSTIATNAWHQIEFKVMFSTTAGTVLLKADDVTLVNIVVGDAISTSASGNAYANAAHFGIDLTTGDIPNADIWFSVSDLILMDTSGSYMNDLLGPRQVKPCPPTANGDYAQWTPSAGQNYACIDEIPPNGDTDYNKTTAVGNIDTFVVPDIVAGATVDAVVMDLYAKMADPGSASLKAVARSNDQDGEGTEVTVSDSYSYQQSVIYVDPNTNNPFTAAAFNAAEFGYKRSA